LCIHFLHFWFFNKVFMHNYTHMWKITITMKMIIIWIIQYLSLKFISFRFCIWKITKTKSFNLVVKKWYPNCEYASQTNSWIRTCKCGCLCVVVQHLCYYWQCETHRHEYCLYILRSIWNRKVLYSLLWNIGIFWIYSRYIVNVFSYILNILIMNYKHPIYI